MSYQTVRHSSRNLDLSAQCDEIEVSAKNLQHTCAVALRGGVEPVLQLPETIQLFTMQDRTAEIPKLEQLVKSIAMDYDQYIAEKQVIDKKLEAVRAERPCKKGDLARYSNKVNFIGHEYINLTARIQQTMVCTVSDYMDFVHPTEQVETAS